MFWEIMMGRALTAETLESSQRNTLSAKSFYFDAITVGVRIEITLWQARSFGAKRQQAETLTSPRLLLDGAFPIPPVTQISSVATHRSDAILSTVIHDRALFLCVSLVPQGHAILRNLPCER